MSSIRPGACSPLRYVGLSLFAVLPFLAACEADSPFDPGMESPEASARQAAAVLPTNGNFALKLDGFNDRVNAAPDPIGQPGSVTVEAWVRVDQAGHLHFVVTNAIDDANDGFSLMVNTSQNVAFFAAASSSTKGVAVSTTALQIGTWYHIAGAYDAVNGLVKIFVDGVEEASVSYSGGISYAAARDLRFGMQVKSFNQSGRYLNGALDEVRIWGSARSAAEIAADMNRDIAGTSDGLLGYWKMDEGSGASTADYTAGNNAGALEAGPVWIQGHPQAPVASAGADQTVECTSPAGASVTLDASGSFDPEGATLTYSWTDSDGNVLASSVNPTLDLGMGSHTITLTVSDGTMSASDDVVITVEDTTAPAVEAALEPIDVGTSDGRFQVAFSCSDSCDANPASTADLNGVAVGNGQIAVLEIAAGGQVVTWEGEVLRIQAPSFTLTANCSDASGNAGSASANPTFAPPSNQSYLFAALYTERAEVERDDGAYEFEVRGQFRLADDSDGINLPNEDVTVSMGDYSAMVPGSSFVRNVDNDGWEYRGEGDTPGIKRVDIDDDGEFRVEGREIDLGGNYAGGVITFSLEIGNDSGQTQIWLDAEGRSESDDDDDDEDDRDGPRFFRRSN